MIPVMLGVSAGSFRLTNSPLEQRPSIAPGARIEEADYESEGANSAAAGLWKIYAFHDLGI